MVEYKKLEDLCNVTYFDRCDSESINGTYPIFCAIGFSGSHNIFNVDENVIICPYYPWSKAINKTNSKVFASDAFTIKPKDSNILDNEYLYKFLVHSYDNFIKMYAYDGMIEECLSNFMIPIVPMSEQKQVDKSFFSSLNVPFDENYVNKVQQKRRDDEWSFYMEAHSRDM